MPRSFRFAVVAAAVLSITACSTDQPLTAPAAPDTAVLLDAAQQDIFWRGGCPRVGTVRLLAAAILIHDRDASSVILAGLRDLDGELKRNRRARIQALAHGLVDYLLQRHAAGKFRGTDAQLAALINAIYCSAGISMSVTDPDNSVLVLPGDGPQVVTHSTGEAGVSLPANAVSEPTILNLVVQPDVFPEPGGGPLDTKLDQYPGFLNISTSSEGGSGLAQPVVVGVCATGVIPQAIRDRLRLGHGKDGGFELTPPAAAGFLDCPNEVAAVSPAPLWNRLLGKLAPKALHASSAVFSGGGVGGTVTEFSPFAAVDPVLSFSGGVGGTVTEFIRETSPVANLATAATEAMTVDCATGIAGTAVAPECRPFITVRTNLGTLLTGVPVEWAVTAGGGTVAARTTYCGEYGPTAITTTNALGQAAACWNLGALGLNSVKATPGVGGDAPAGVTFVPADTTFSVTAVAGAPAAITIIGGDGQSAVCSTVLANPIVARVTDAYGNPVAGVAVTWKVTQGGGSVTPIALVTAADGTVSASWKLGTGTTNKLKATVQGTDLHTYATATGIPD